MSSIRQISTPLKISSSAARRSAGSGLHGPPSRNFGFVHVLMLHAGIVIPSSARKPSRARSAAFASRSPFIDFSNTLWWISIASTPAALVRRHCPSNVFSNAESSEWYPGGAKRSQKSPADQCPTLIRMFIAFRKSIDSSRPM